MTTNDKQFVEEITDISKINLIEPTEETTPGIRLLERLADDMEKRTELKCSVCGKPAYEQKMLVYVETEQKCNTLCNIHLQEYRDLVNAYDHNSDLSDAIAESLNYLDTKYEESDFRIVALEKCYNEANEQCSILKKAIESYGKDKSQS